MTIDRREEEGREETLAGLFVSTSIRLICLFVRQIHQSSSFFLPPPYLLFLQLQPLFKTDSSLIRYPYRLQSFDQANVFSLSSLSKSKKYASLRLEEQMVRRQDPFEEFL